MKASYVILLFVISFSLFFTSLEEESLTDISECASVSNPTSSSSCEGKKVSDGHKYCCYRETELTNDTIVRECDELSNSAYENIDDYIDILEKKSNVDDVEIDCGTRYLTLGLLAVAVLLF